MAAEINTLREITTILKDVAERVEVEGKFYKTTFLIGCVIFAVGTAYMCKKCNDVLKSIKQMKGEVRDEIKLIKNLIGPQIVATDVIRAVNALAKGKEIKVILIPCAGSLQLSLKTVNT